MMLPLLIALAAPQQTALDAEYAFAAKAQTDGLWTAFRATATDDAVMFDPKPVNAQAFLKDRKDPPKAIEWWPAATYTSCDGKLAVNTGPFRMPNGTTGYFTTVWVRQPDGGWKWVYDGGDTVDTAGVKPAEVQTLKPDCDTPPNYEAAHGEGIGESPDHTLGYSWTVDDRGGRVFSVTMWNGTEGEEVLRNDIKSPSPPRTQ